jgi:hypothetical protein
MVEADTCGFVLNDRRRVVQARAVVGLQTIQPYHHRRQRPVLSDATALPVCNAVHDDSRQEGFERLVGADRNRFRAATASRHGRVSAANPSWFSIWTSPVGPAL